MCSSYNPTRLWVLWLFYCIAPTCDDECETLVVSTGLKAIHALLCCAVFDYACDHRRKSGIFVGCRSIEMEIKNKGCRLGWCSLAETCFVQNILPAQNTTPAFGRPEQVSDDEQSRSHPLLDTTCNNFRMYVEIRCASRDWVRLASSRIFGKTTHAFTHIAHTHIH